jgi:uncharacterized protein (TIGR02145 family)
MKKVILILSVFVSSLALSLYPQNFELTFTGDNNGQPVMLDSVIVKNVTQGGEVTLYSPDLSLVLIITGIENGINEKDASFSLHQNYPNPFNDQTKVQLQLSGTALVKMVVSNLLGQNLLSSNSVLGAGIHTFSFSPGNEACCFLTASTKSQTETIKMLCNPSGKRESVRLNYVSNTVMNPILKTLQFTGELPFEIGDELLMIAYSASGESGMVKSPEMSQDYIMQFATNIACPGFDSLLYENQWYHTIQVGGQCWMKENLNVGELIPASQSQTNNNILEKYCPLDNEYYCNVFSGGLYQWNEMMNYVNESGAQGICPNGWHIPTDYEWRVLEGATDSEYAIGDSEWGSNGWRGTDAGGNLKQTGFEWWESPNNGATDAYGFSALPGGYIVQNEYWGGGWKAYFWSSHTSGHYFRNMDWNQTMIKRDNGVGGGLAITVRCVKDE